MSAQGGNYSERGIAQREIRLFRLLFFLLFGANGGFGGLKADAAVSAVAEWLVHRAAATAEREVDFAGQIIFVTVGVDEFDGAFGSLHAEGPVFPRYDFDLCHVSSEWNKCSLIQFMQLQKADPSLAQQRVQEHALLLRSLGMTAF